MISFGSIPPPRWRRGGPIKSSRSIPIFRNISSSSREVDDDPCRRRDRRAGNSTSRAIDRLLRGLGEGLISDEVAAISWIVSCNPISCRSNKEKSKDAKFSMILTQASQLIRLPHHFLSTVEEKNLVESCICGHGHRHRRNDRSDYLQTSFVFGDPRGAGGLVVGRLHHFYTKNCKYYGYAPSRQRWFAV